MDHPDLIYVIADQWRAQDLGYAGNPEVHTPHLDAFAAEAVDCHLAVSASPVCTPARASLLTGLLPHRHRLVCNDVPLDPGLPSLGKSFAAAGYATAYVGKWHVDGHGRHSYIPRERRQGFQHFAVLECTHDYGNSRYFLDDDPEPKVWEGYDAEAQTRHACRWLDAQAAEQPACLVLAWGPPHNPYQTAPDADRQRYTAADLSLRGNVPAERAERARGDLAGYYAHGTALDRCFAEVLAAVARRGRPAYVVFTSDHGDFIGSHGLWDKQGPWDEAIRIPLLIRGPDLPAGRNATVSNHSDHWPTLAALCGVTVPDGLDGRDLSAHLRTGTTPTDNASLVGAYHTFGNWPKFTGKVDPLFTARIYRGLRTERWTYCRDPDGPWLLYDNIADPFQLRNRVGDPACAEVQTRLDATLDRRLAAHDDDVAADGVLTTRFGYGLGPGETMSTRG